MISSAYIGSTLVTTSNWLLQSIKASFPEVRWSKANRGGFLGSEVSVGKFGGFGFAAEWMIVGNTISDLATQRENFIKLLGDIFRTGSQTFKINKSNGVNVQIDVLAAKVRGSVDAVSPVSSKLLIEFIAEKPFFEAQSATSSDVHIYTGGGWSVPMPVPLDMSVGGSNDVTLTNNGNYEAYPVLTFYGPLESPSLSNLTTGKSMSLNYTLSTSSDYIVVDVYNRTVVLYTSGTNIRSVFSGDWITLDPGDNLLHLTAATYNTQGKVNVSFRDTYLGV